MVGNDTSTGNDENLRAAMEAAWRDHHHARDQTWKCLEMEAILGAGLVTVDAQFGILVATIAAGLLVIAASCFGIMITLNHRRLERRKFIHIINCEELLGLHRDDVIPLQREMLSCFGIEGSGYDSRKSRSNNPKLVAASSISVPRELMFWDAFRFRINNTAVFILRMHIAIILFAGVLVIARIATGPKGV